MYGTENGAHPCGSLVHACEVPAGVSVQDLPFAAAVGSCYAHVAAELLRRLEGLQHNRAKLCQKVLYQLHCICSLEEGLTICLPHPHLVRQRLAGTTHKSSNEVTFEHCNNVLNALASASLHNMPVPYWNVVSGLQAVAAPSVSQAVAQWRSHVKRSTIMLNKAGQQAQLPDIGTCHWMLTTPMQKLEQLGAQLNLARSSNHSTMVLVGTESVAVYLCQLLETIQDQWNMSFGTVFVFTPEMSFQEVHCLTSL